jgi:hypothetical protein
MKALLQSKTLYEALKKIDFKKVSVVQECLTKDCLRLLLSSYKAILIPCEALEITKPIVQQGIEWDKIREIVQRVPEMPFVLTLEGNKASLTFEV